MDSYGMTVKEVADRCGVTPKAVRNWIRGIRCGGVKVKLASVSVGNRDRIGEAALAKFHDDCHRAKYGEPTPPRVESPTQKAKRIDAEVREAYEALGMI